MRVQEEGQKAVRENLNTMAAATRFSAVPVSLQCRGDRMKSILFLLREAEGCFVSGKCGKDRNALRFFLITTYNQLRNAGRFEPAREVPMPFALSKSRYCSAVQCPKMLWMKKYMPEQFDESVMNDTVLETGNEVGDLAMGLFGKYVEVPFGDLSEMTRITDRLIQENTPVICEASFAFEGLFCSVDILKNLGEGKVELYEVKSSTGPHPIYEDDICYQVYVLKKLGFHVKKACLVYLDRGYERIGDLDIQKLFAVQDYSRTVSKKLPEVEARIAFLKQYMEQKEEPEQELGEQCFSPYACGFYHYCGRHLPVPNVFDLRRVQLRTRIKLYRQGSVSFEDLSRAEGVPEAALMQVRHELEDLPDHVEPENIRTFLEMIQYPLYFLDFETFQPAVPVYDHTHPYDQIPFQYSLHYQKKKGGRLYHREFLAEPLGDPRRKLAEQLCQDIPEGACVLAYNMAFEKTRIRELAALYPDLSDHLLSIHANMKDLIVPFQKRWFYNRAMKGSHSIKYVLPALYPDDPQLDYQSLDGVHNGAEASFAFTKMQKMDPSELSQYRQYLLKYCGLDTLAMVKVLEKLYEVCGA